MQQLEQRDYFTDHDILIDPYTWFEAIRAKGPVYRPPGKDYVVVTGYAEALQTLNNLKDFSSSISLQGAGAPLPFSPTGADITADLESHRSQILGFDQVVNIDGERHTALRSLLTPLFTPSRLKANEAFIARYSDQLVGDAVKRGGCELIREISTPFVTLVIADLLGVPAADRDFFIKVIEAAPPPGSLDGSDNTISENHPFVVLGKYFGGYLYERRQQPRQDILTEFANAKYPDGSSPALEDLVGLGTFLFAAGQDTSAKLLGNAMRYIVDQPGLQDRLRQEPQLIGPMLEEVLRMEGSVKQTARLAVRDTRIGDVEVPAGTKVLLALSAANRDGSRWSNPQQFEIDRPKIKEHLAFGRGKHVCIGAPLARAEVRIILEKFLEHTSSIDLAEAHHGPRGKRTLDFEASFIIRGLSALHLKLAPARAARF